MAKAMPSHEARLLLASSHAGSGGSNSRCHTLAAGSRLLWRDCVSAVDFLQNCIAPAAEQGLADGFPEPNRVAAVTRLAQDLGSIGTSHHRIQVQTPIPNFRKRSNGYLAAPA